MKKYLHSFIRRSLCLAWFLMLCPLLSFAQGNRHWATYYGGKNPDHGNSVATDIFGNVYLAGYTVSDSGIAFGGFQNTSGGGGDAFLVKFDAAGNRVWATFYGGAGYDHGTGVATDASGNVYMAGYTLSTTGIASGGFQNTFGGNPYDAFLVKFDTSGNRLWATYYGGALNDEGWSVATDGVGNVYLAGISKSVTGIASGGFQNALAGDYDAFLVKFNTVGTRLWATYYGGGDYEQGWDVTADASGNVYLSGMTKTTVGIASGGFQNAFGGGTRDCFLVKFDSTGSRLWATYYGGESYEDGFSVATDPSENVYLAGWSKSMFGIASGGFQNTNSSGGIETFLAKFDVGGNRLWATYYGGAVSAGNNAITATDALGNVYLAGEANFATGIASGGFQNTFGGGSDAFLVQFDSSGNRLCATYYGGTDQDFGHGIAADASGNIYMAGLTYSTSSIASTGGFDDSCYCGTPGTYDAYIVKFTSCNTVIVPPAANFQSSDSLICANDCINFTDLSTNADAWIWSFPGGSPSSSTLQHPPYVCYLTPGIYNATLIAANSGGSDSLTLSKYINVKPAPPTPVITQTGATLYCSTDPSYTSYQWFADTTLIPGATDTSLVINQGGNYNIQISNESGCKTAVGINIILGMENIFRSLSGLQLRVHPNPAVNQLSVSSWQLAGKKVAIEFYNVLGEKVYTGLLSTDCQLPTVIDISGLAKGLYIVQLTVRECPDMSQRTKFIKE